MKNYTADMTTFFDPTGKQPTDMQFYFGPKPFQDFAEIANDLSLSQKRFGTGRPGLFGLAHYPLGKPLVHY